MKKFATAINCIDGRILLKVWTYVTSKFSVDYVDMITEPGPVKILTEGVNKQVINNIKERVDISINNHNSNHIVIVGHFDCAGNLAPKEVQIEQIKQSISIVSLWWPHATVTGMWIDEDSSIKEYEIEKSTKIQL